MRAWYRDVSEIWGRDAWVQLEALFDVGDRLLVFYLARGRGQRSEVDVAMRNAAVARSRNGVLVYVKVYANRDDALRELGVAIAELEPIAL